MHKKYDTVIIGAGAAGMLAAVSAANSAKNVLLLEKLPKAGAKLKATGGGRCNLSNTLPNDEFISRFGKNGRFMQYAIDSFDHSALREFFASIGVQTDTLDGFRIFPAGHSSSTVIEALLSHIQTLGIEIQTSQPVQKITRSTDTFVVVTPTDTYHSSSLILATGGKGYPTLGAEGDGYTLASSLGHSCTQIYPAMMPLRTLQSWGASCRADTIANAHIKVDIKKHKKLQAKGDLIFTQHGIRGPVVLDFSREITPLLEKLSEVPILINMTKGMSQEDIRAHIKQKQNQPQHYTTLELLQTLLPLSISKALCQLAGADTQIGFAKQSGSVREKLIELLAWTPMTISGHDGFDKAMITRGGIKLNEIDSKTMQSKIVDGLYFCGEIVDIDGPCGGYNLQWSFASGVLAGKNSQKHPSI